MVLWLNVCLSVYAVIMLGGGIMGFKLGHSIESLISGIVSFLVLGGSVALSKNNPRLAYGIAAVTVLALIVVFVRRGFETSWPPRSIGLAVGSVLMLVLLAVGHLTNRN